MRNCYSDWKIATFSLDGRYIYTINSQQEICTIDLQDFSLVRKRRVEGLSNPEEVISSHIQQLTQWVFAIGSMIKIKVENPEDEASFKPCLHVIFRDISDPKKEPRKRVYEIPISESASPSQSVIFRSLCIKER